MQTQPNTIRVIVFKDCDMWVAQCLEHDIGAQAPDIDTLMERLEVAIAAECKESVEKHGKPFEGIEPAPERFQHMWDRRSAVEMTPPPWMQSPERPVALGLVA